MKFIYLLLAVLIISIDATAQKKLKLNSGREIPIRITSMINSNSKDNSINAVVDVDIKDENGEKILIRRGTPVNMSAEITKAKGCGKPASIKLTFVSTNAVDGQNICLRGEYNKIGKNKKGLAWGLSMGIGIGLLCPPALFCLMIKGEKVIIPENTMVTYVLVNDMYKINVTE